MSRFRVRLTRLASSDEQVSNVCRTSKCELTDHLYQIGAMYAPLAEATKILLRIRNSRKPIQRLPTEIVINILALIPGQPKLVRPYAPYWHSACADSLMLVPISRTCHRLREVTLANPMLWSHGYALGRKSTFPIFRSRSQGVPLTVLLTEKTGKYVRVLRTIRQASFSRVRELHLCEIAQDEFIKSVVPFLQLPWPMLEHLTVATHSNLLNPPQWAPPRVDNLPHLRYLHLRFVFPQQGLPRLTHLSVSNVMARRDCRPRLVAFILSCPMLESIHLTVMDDFVSEDPAPATHPNLRRVTL